MWGNLQAFTLVAIDQGSAGGLGRLHGGVKHFVGGGVPADHARGVCGRAI